LENLQALHAVDQAINASLDLRLSLNVLLEQAATRLGVDASSVLLFNPNLQTLEFVAGHGFKARLDKNTQLRLDGSLAGKAILERRTISIADLESRLLNNPRANLVNMHSEGFVAFFAVPLLAKGETKGVLEVFHRTPIDPNPEWLDFLETLAGQAAIAIDNSQLFEHLQHANLELSLAYDATIEGWSHALDLRDKETEGHTQRVTEMTQLLGRAFGLSGEQLLHIRRGSLLHDIGKLGVPDYILLKPGPLTDEEWVTMKKHPVYAYEMLSPIAYLRPALDIPYSHHEKWDGTGYPRGLKGEQIPLAARIFTVVDVWDALISDRPYRKAWTETKALDYLREQRGKHFNSQVVDEFIRLLDHV
jgi:HD-GYP domain-containing protein (c-di-GMP phosphodiesterase class II)